MIQRSLEPDVVSFNIAMSACNTSKQWEKALQLFEEMQHRRLEPDVISFNISMNACTKSKQWEKALQSFEEMIQRSHASKPLTLMRLNH